jgi:hypothetical protein
MAGQGDLAGLAEHSQERRVFGDLVRGWIEPIVWSPRTVTMAFSVSPS